MDRSDRFACDFGGVDARGVRDVPEAHGPGQVRIAAWVQVTARNGPSKQGALHALDPQQPEVLHRAGVFHSPGDHPGPCPARSFHNSADRRGLRGTLDIPRQGRAEPDKVRTDIRDPLRGQGAGVSDAEAESPTPAKIGNQPQEARVTPRVGPGRLQHHAARTQAAGLNFFGKLAQAFCRVIQGSGQEFDEASGPSPQSRRGAHGHAARIGVEGVQLPADSRRLKNLRDRVNPFGVHADQSLIGEDPVFARVGHRLEPRFDAVAGGRALQFNFVPGRHIRRHPGQRICLRKQGQP